MPVVIRLHRAGKPHEPYYRVTVADSRRPTCGKFIEVIGNYTPSPKGQTKRLTLDLEKAKAWIKKGAQPSERVRSLIRDAEKGE
jgi:small subunit ribosomal protein S16